MTENEQQEVIDRGVHAKALLENPAYTEAFDVTLERAFATFMSTSPDEGSVRDACWATCNALRELQATVEAFISNADLELKNREYDRKQHRDHQ